MSLRKLNFFDRKPVNISADPRVQEIVSKVTCSKASPDGSVWIGTSDGRLGRIDASFALLCCINAFPSDQPVLSLQSAKQAVLALGRLGQDGSTRLCAYHLYRTSDQGLPSLIGSVRIPPDMNATCIDVTPDFTFIVAGCLKGHTLVYFGSSFGRPGVKPRILFPDNPSPVSSVRLVGAKLFIVTENEVTSVKLSETSAEVVNIDSSQSPLIRNFQQVTLSGDILLIAKPEAVYGYSHEQGNVSATSLLNSKEVYRIDAWRHFLLIFSSEGIAIIANYPSSVSGGIRLSAGSFSVNGQILSICPSVFDGHSVLIFTESPPAGGDVTVSILREKSVPDQLEALAQKFLFEWAIDVAIFENQSKSVVTQLYRRFADHLFEQSEFDKSISVFIRAAEAGLPLETSYAINKFLFDGNGLRNTNKLKHVSEYLFKLHAIGPSVLKPEHTTLLILILQSINEEEKIKKVFEMVPESCVLDICSGSPSLIDLVPADVFLDVFKYSGNRCLELLAESQRFGKLNELLHAVKNKTSSLAAVIKTSPLIKLHISLTASLFETLSNPCDSAHASYCHSKRVPSVSSLPADSSYSPEYLKLLLELTLRSKGNSKDIVRSMINKNMAKEALFLCKLFGAPASVILPLCAALNNPFEALAYPAMPLEEVVRSIPSGQKNIDLFSLAVARRSNTKPSSSEFNICNIDKVAVSILLETAYPGSMFGSIKGAVLSEFKRLELTASERQSRADKDVAEISRMKNEISLLKRKPLIHNLGRPCALCKAPLSELPVTLFKCMHGFHQQCAMDWIECKICALESQHNKDILNQRKQAVNKHDEMFKCMSGNPGSRFDVIMAYLGHGLFSH